MRWCMRVSRCKSVLGTPCCREAEKLTHSDREVVEHDVEVGEAHDSDANSA